MSGTRSEQGAARTRRRDGLVKRLLLLALMGAVVALFAAGCGGSSSDDSTNGGSGTSTSASSGSQTKPFKLGFMVVDLKNAQYASQVAMTRKMVERAGGRLVVADLNNDPAKQLQVGQDWLNSHTVDAILAQVVDVNSFQPVLDQAAKQGTPVVFPGFVPARGLQRAQHTVTQDFVGWGRMMGEAAGRCVDDRLGGRGQAVLMDIPEIAGPIVPAFDKGMKQGLAENAGIDLVAVPPAGADRLRAFNEMQSVLQAHPGANVVVSANEEPVLGALRALVAAGKDPKTQLCLIGSGGNPEATADLKRGDLYAQIDIHIPTVMQLLVDSAQALIKNPDDPRYSTTTENSPLGLNYAPGVK